MNENSKPNDYKSYANFLVDKYGYCVDLTSTTTLPQLYQPSSNTKLNAQTIVLKKNEPRIPFSVNSNILITETMAHLPHISGTGFNPSGNQFFEYRGATLANRYIPFQPDISGVQINPILFEYFERLFENEQDEKYILDFLADIIQNPARKPQWGLLITGEPGCGKSRLLQLVQLALGGNHCFIESEYGKSLDKFSETFVENLLVAYDDPATGNKEAYEKLKLKFTQAEPEIELKGVQTRVNRRSYSRIILLHNSERPWVFEADDRRLYVAERMTHKSQHNPSGDTANTAAFFRKFINWIESPEAAAQIYKFFIERDLSGFTSGSTVQTAAHQRMAQLSVSVVDTVISEFFNDHGTDYRFLEPELLAYLADAGVSNIPPDSIKLKLAALNYERQRMNIEVNKKEWVWRPICIGRSPALTEEEKSRFSKAF